ncbi:LamG domain-containing protein [Streptomyces sp. NPDC018031]|uniref:LamG domain-containing protein n=1 Tax=Streptomyces sp. NPDC018031 TaxID=3365033 RepID=UPI0037A5E4DB
MTRRWTLITTIAVLAVALTFTVVQLVGGDGAGESGKERAGAEPASPNPGADADSLRGVAWWPLHGSGTAKAGEHDASVVGGAEWTDGPGGGALGLDGSSGYADTDFRIDTAGADYSVAARVRLAPEGMDGFHTALSQDGDQVSAFSLQYAGPDRTFVFSFPGARTVAENTEQPQPGRWYHLTGTYSRQDHRVRIYVDGRLAGAGVASEEGEPTGTVAIGRSTVEGQTASHWMGDIADVHVYDRELTPDEVRSLSAREPD